MEEKFFEVKVPKGYEIDREKSTLERIVFKKLRTKEEECHLVQLFFSDVDEKFKMFKEVCTTSYTDIEEMLRDIPEDYNLIIDTLDEIIKNYNTLSKNLSSKYLSFLDGGQKLEFINLGNRLFDVIKANNWTDKEIQILDKVFRVSTKPKITKAKKEKKTDDKIKKEKSKKTVKEKLKEKPKTRKV